MENHHHCKICGNMISPSKRVCQDCERNPPVKRDEKDILSDEEVRRIALKYAKKMPSSGY